MKKRDVFLFGLISILFFVVIYGQIQQTRANTAAANAFAESQRRDELRRADATEFVKYESIKPFIAKVGEPLQFQSTLVVQGYYQIEYTDELRCNINGVIVKVQTNKDNAASIPNDGSSPGNPWPYPYIPDRATTCNLRTVYCFTVEGIEKCGVFVSDNFDVTE